MEIDKAIPILKSKIEATAVPADRLVYSIGRANGLGLAPLTMEKLSALSDSDMEVMDAFLYRYGTLVSNIQDAIFKTIGEAEQEPVTTMSNRDKMNLMERLGALPSAEVFSSIAYIRNKLMHDYPEETKKQLDRINFVTAEAPQLVAIFLGIVKYAEKFGIHSSINEFSHLSRFASDTVICNICNTTPCICSKNKSGANGLRI